MTDTGLFEVAIRIHDEAELYNSFDPSGGTLSGDFMDYIEDNLRERQYGDKPVLHIVTDQNIDVSRLKNALRNYSKKQSAALERRKKVNRINGLRMLSIGLFFIVLGIILHDNLGSVIATVIETLGSFSVWEAANIWLEELPKLRLMERILRHLTNTNVKISVDSGLH